MTRVLRAALTETRNAFAGMPASIEQLGSLSGRLDELRDANLAHHQELVAEAAHAGAQLVGLGELFSAPYFALHEDPLWFALAEDALDGPSVTAMREAAAEHGVLIVAPIYELERMTAKRFNTAVLIDEQGEVLGKYRKAHIPEGANEQGEFHETFYYGRSDGRLWPSVANVSRNPYFPVFETSVGRLGVAICYDRHFEGVVRTLAANGAELVLSPAVTFGATSRRMWELEFQVDAARHRVFIGGSNRRGVEPPFEVEYFGASGFFGPDGRVESVPSRPELVIADLDLDPLAAPGDAGWDLGRDARPEILD